MHELQIKVKIHDTAFMLTSWKSGSPLKLPNEIQSD
jgi:hypothetical protein